MKKTCIGVLATLVFFFWTLAPDLSSKKDALMAIELAEDTNDAHVMLDVNNAANKTVDTLILLLLIGTTVFVATKELKKKKEIA